MEIVNTNSVNMYNYLNSNLLNPYIFIIVILIVVSLFVYLGNTNNSFINSDDNDSNMRVIIIVGLGFSIHPNQAFHLRK